MFVVLDTNHFTEFADGSELGSGLVARIQERQADVFTCIPAVEETMRGWLALLHRQSPGRKQLRAYADFQRGIETLIRFPILPFDDAAASVFHRFRDARVRVGTMDLKIAAICIAHGATLLTRNLVDFEKVPGLRVENWLD
jgi:tRNA(fMet)-specific endonuclease VapC